MNKLRSLIGIFIASIGCISAHAQRSNSQEWGGKWIAVEHQSVDAQGNAAWIPQSIFSLAAAFQDPDSQAMVRSVKVSSIWVTNPGGEQQRVAGRTISFACPLDAQMASGSAALLHRARIAFNLTKPDAPWASEFKCGVLGEYRVSLVSADSEATQRISQREDEELAAIQAAESTGVAPATAQISPQSAQWMDMLAATVLLSAWEVCVGQSDQSSCQKTVTGLKIDLLTSMLDPQSLGLTAEQFTAQMTRRVDAMQRRMENPAGGKRGKDAGKTQEDRK